MTGYYIVEANSIEEAKEKTYDLPLTDAQEVEYLQGSHEPDIDEKLLIDPKIKTTWIFALKFGGLKYLSYLCSIK